MPAQAMRCLAGDGHAEADTAGIPIARAFQTKERLDQRL